MDFTPDGSLIVDTALSMSRAADEALSRDATELARLVQATLQGDSAAFECLILRYEARITTLATRLLGTRDDASDAAQEVFLRAFKYLHRLDLRKPVEPWLMRITVNVCRDAIRGRQRRQCALVDMEPPETVDASPDQLDGLMRKEERRILQKALCALPEHERLAIILRDVEGLSTAEVADILQSSETTVRSQISRGRVRLKATIDRLAGGEP